MAMIDRVKWDGAPGQLAWKYPSQALSTGTQLIVNESQVAFVVQDGVYQGPFGAGRHTLSTNNLPLLRKLVGLPFGGQSPFTAEVWFVSLTSTLDVRWGTPDPIQLQDPKFGLMVPVRAFGQYGIRIADPKLFLMSLVGTARSLDAATLAAYFRAMHTTRIKTAIAAAIGASGVSVLEISTRLDALSHSLRETLARDIADYGVQLSQFSIESINLPEADPAVQTLKAALARRAEMDIVGFDYQQERRFDVLQSAAANQGSAATVLGAGMGLALGSALGAGVGQMAATLAPAAHGERIAMLRELAALREQNILTEAEFDAEKKRILA
jgi:membrane protease subunit (stomatin/prohibitin family)